MICFNTLAGVGALTSCKLAGKTNRNTFFLGCTDSEDQTLKLIAAQNSIMQANWGAFFPASMILMARDGINKFHGKAIMPTRLIFGLTIVTPTQAKSFDKITFDPLNPKYAYVFTKYFKYLRPRSARRRSRPASSSAAVHAHVAPVTLARHRALALADAGRRDGAPWEALGGLSGDD